MREKGKERAYRMSNASGLTFPSAPSGTIYAVIYGRVHRSQAKPGNVTQGEARTAWSGTTVRQTHTAKHRKATRRTKNEACFQQNETNKTNETLDQRKNLQYPVIDVESEAPAFLVDQSEARVCLPPVLVLREQRRWKVVGKKDRPSGRPCARRAT